MDVLYIIEFIWMYYYILFMQYIHLYVHIYIHTHDYILVWVCVSKKLGNENLGTTLEVFQLGSMVGA